MGTTNKIVAVRCTLEYGAGYRGRQFHECGIGNLRKTIINLSKEGNKVFNVRLQRAMVESGEEDWCYPSNLRDEDFFGTVHNVILKQRIRNE